MNLENLGLVELNAQEVQEVEGGSIFLILLFAAIVIGFGLLCQSDPDRVTVVQ